MTGDAYLRAEVADDVQRRLAGVRGTGFDADRMVSAVVSGTGALVDLAFHPAAPALGATRLGAAIVEAARNAEADATRRGYTMLALALGDEATLAVEAAAYQPQQPSQPPAEEDDDLASFDASVFRSDR